VTQHPALAEGRVAVITGAASGIGLAAALRFARLCNQIPWAAEDIIRSRTALSRWHPGDKDQLAAFLADGEPARSR
jgi:NAD(P)-dependent dehydrogenase (short-subunit alcohol dehydrogenase family)